MSLDVREVHRIAALARLRLDAEQERRFAGQLSEVVEYIDQLGALVSGSGVAVAAAAPREAADEVVEGLERDRFLANAPASQGPFLLVPQVIGSGDA